MFLIAVNLILSSLTHMYSEILTDDDFQESEAIVKKVGIFAIIGITRYKKVIFFQVSSCFSFKKIQKDLFGIYVSSYFNTYSNDCLFFLL